VSVFRTEHTGVTVSVLTCVGRGSRVDSVFLVFLSLLGRTQGWRLEIDHRRTHPNL
jgi:hypothetical protein